MPNVELLIDTDKRVVIESIFSQQHKTLPSPVFGEKWNVQAIMMAPLQTSIAGRQWSILDVFTGDVIRIGAGRVVAAQPTAGTQTFTWGGDTTTALPYNMTSAQVQTALNLLASITAAGGVTVAGSDGFFTVTFNTVGVRTNFSSNTTLLGPESFISIGKLVTGSASAQDVSTFRTEQAPIALATLTLGIAASDVVVNTVQPGDSTHNHNVTVVLTPAPYGGYFTLTVGSNETTFIPIGVSPEDFVAALEALASVGVGNVSVVPIGDYSWSILFIGTKSNTDMGTITKNANYLLSKQGLTGTLDFGTSGAELLLLSNPSAAITLEAEYIASGLTRGPKILREDITILESVLDPDSISPTPRVSALISSVSGRPIVPLNNLSGTSHTLQLADFSAYAGVQQAAATTFTLTVDNDSSVNFEVGANIAVVRLGTGAMNIAAASGVTILSRSSLLGIPRWGRAFLLKLNNNAWLLSGDIV